MYFIFEYTRSKKETVHGNKTPDTPHIQTVAFCQYACQDKIFYQKKKAFAFETLCMCV